MGTQRLLAMIAVVLTAASPLFARAFSADGYASGMSPEQVAATARDRSLEAWEISGDGMAIGRRSEYRVDGTFGFCDGRMFFYSRTIDFDADYYQTVQGFLAKYGQPEKVVTAEQPWPGPGGGNVRSVELAWRQAADRVVLSVVPEGRDGKGQLRHNRQASVSFTSGASCSASQFR